MFFSEKNHPKKFEFYQHYFGGEKLINTTLKRLTLDNELIGANSIIFFNNLNNLKNNHSIDFNYIGDITKISFQEENKSNEKKNNNSLNFNLNINENSNNLMNISTKRNDEINNSNNEVKSSIFNINENKFKRKRAKSLIFKKNILTENNNSKLYDIEMKESNYLENKLSKNKILNKSKHSKSLINIKNKQSKQKKENNPNIINNNKFNQNLEVIMNMNKIHLLKRGISSDTYSYYQSKTKNDNKSRNYSPINSLNKFKQKKQNSKRNSIYCPRLYNEKIMKKWEEINNKNWYKLNPEERMKANQEMEEMIRNNLI